jgi:hypothetical protein
MHARAEEPVRRCCENWPRRRRPWGRSIRPAVLAPTVDEEEGPPPPEIGGQVCGGELHPGAAQTGRAGSVAGRASSRPRVREGGVRRLP